MAWKFADVWEGIARAQPERPAIIQAGRTITWGAFDARADALASCLIDSGLQHQSKVAAILHNGPEYLEACFAALKAGFAPVNANFRYGAEELLYLLDNADAEAVVFNATHADRLAAIRARLPKVRAWIAVAEEGLPSPDWALDYETVVGASAPDRPVKAPWGRSPDDAILLYTGGTTGSPKGVVWRQDDVFNLLGGGGYPALGLPPASSAEELATRVLTPGHFFPLTLVACPLMHGTGLFSAFIAFNQGGAAAFLPSRSFDAEELWNEIQRLGADSVVIAGQAFALPMLEALRAAPQRWNISSLRTLISSGAMWSREHKTALLEFAPEAAIYDSFGSSETLGMGWSRSTRGDEVKTAAFMLGPNGAVFSEDGQRVAPGSGERGLVAQTGYLPIGYYKDPERSAKVFRTIEGRRWSVPGDWAEVNADGTVTLLGRGSGCINTGGEKVFPEEVEEVLKRHPDVRDAAVIGAPDPRFGERVCAVVQAAPGAAPTLEALSAHVRATLAGYKAPRALVMVDSLGRGANGKIDLARLKQQALAKLAQSAS